MIESFTRDFGKVIVFVLAVLPFQYLWLLPIEKLMLPELLTFALTNWYELIILISTPLVVIRLLRNNESFFWFELVLAGVFILGAISSIWSPTDLKTDLIGIRYGVGFIAFYFAARVSFISFTTIYTVLRYALIIVVCLALSQVIVWSFYGSLPLWLLSVRDYAGDLPRVYGSFIGPNQLATYVMIVSLWLYGNKKIGSWLFAGSVLVVLATFSRSALLGTVAGILVLLWQNRSKFMLRPAHLFVIVLGIIAIATTVVGSQLVADTYLYSRHTPERVITLQNAVERFQSASLFNKLAGYGITTAGPSTFSSQNIYVPENWYLQVLHELGIIGLLAITLGIVYMVKYLLKNGNIAILPVVVALAINSLFLHPLADNPTAALTIFTILGVLVTQASKSGQVEI